VFERKALTLIVWGVETAVTYMTSDNGDLSQ